MKTLLEEQNKPVVMICIPHHGSVSMEWTDRMYTALKTFQPDMIKDYRLMKGILNLDTERNLLVKEALKNELMTHILWVDTDMIPEEPLDPNQALRMLLACDAPIASGLYRVKQKTGFNWAMWNKVEGGSAPIGKWTEGSNWIQADHIGMGFCLIKREVFETVPYPWFRWWHEFPSEDFSFCDKVAEYGYEIRVMTDVRLSHIGQLKVLSSGTVTTLDI